MGNNSKPIFALLVCTRARAGRKSHSGWVVYNQFGKLLGFIADVDKRGYDLLLDVEKELNKYRGGIHIVSVLEGSGLEVTMDSYTALCAEKRKFRPGK